MLLLGCLYSVLALPQDSFTVTEGAGMGLDRQTVSPSMLHPVLEEQAKLGLSKGIAGNLRQCGAGVLVTCSRTRLVPMSRGMFKK